MPFRNTSARRVNLSKQLSCIVAGLRMLTAAARRALRAADSSVCGLLSTSSQKNLSFPKQDRTLVLRRFLTEALAVLWRSGAARSGLAQREHFHAALARECSRAERLQVQVALIVFTPRELDTAVAAQRRIADLLRGRVRVTDVVGWYDSARVGALLPGTDKAGAWKVADEVCLGFTDDIPAPVCNIYLCRTEPGSFEGQPAQREGVMSQPAVPQRDGRGGGPDSGQHPDVPA